MITKLVFFGHLLVERLTIRLAAETKEQKGSGVCQGQSAIKGHKLLNFRGIMKKIGHSY